MATYKEMLAEKEALEARMQEQRATELESVKAQIYALMEEYSLTFEELMPRRRGRKAGTGAVREKAEAKYQDPKTGKTWSGMGRAPAWLKGKKRERFLINAEPQPAE